MIQAVLVSLLEEFLKPSKPKEWTLNTSPVPFEFEGSKKQIKELISPEMATAMGQKLSHPGKVIVVTATDDCALPYKGVT
jgi:hypothetical protein